MIGFRIGIKNIDAGRVRAPSEKAGYRNLQHIIHHYKAGSLPSQEKTSRVVSQETLMTIPNAIILSEKTKRR